MKGLDEKIAAVMQAEAECIRQRRDADVAWNDLKGEVRRAATPVRIVVSGLALGFVSGFTTSKAASAASGKLVAGPIFSMLLETVLPAALAGFTAMRADSAEGEDDDGAAQEEPNEPAPEPAPAVEAPAARPRVRRRPRVDSAT